MASRNPGDKAMSNTNTGGPAFAHQLESNRDGYAITGGMTLRDYFAAKAMQSLIIANGPAPQGGWPTYAEHTAYLVADAMLKAREA
jgi:hypothetical protein